MRFLWALALLTTPLQAQDFAAAGVPRSLAAARDYPALFAHLEDNGIGLFFPTFQYVEYPALIGYGFEPDFLPPCSPDDPAFKALRASTVQLILPGPLLYPVLPEALRQVLACAGGHVAAVSSFDEPVSNEVSFSEVTQLYEQVKMVAPTLDVIMVHAPVPDDNRSVVPTSARLEYFESVRKFSDMAGMGHAAERRATRPNGRASWKFRNNYLVGPSCPSRYFASSLARHFAPDCEITPCSNGSRLPVGFALQNTGSWAWPRLRLGRGFAPLRRRIHPRVF